MTGEQYAVIERIARVVMRRHRADTPLLSPDDRYQAALDGQVELICEHGWPGADKPLYNAASLAITREHREQFRHIRRWTYWYEPPGSQDAMAEGIIERIAIWQVAWMLTDAQWVAVWAMGEALRRGAGQRTAAALAGVSLTVFKTNLYRARRRCLDAWCAPGEHIGFYYASSGDGRPRGIHGAIEKRRARDKQAAA
jgi:hypothetical protein